MEEIRQFLEDQLNSISLEARENIDI